MKFSILMKIFKRINLNELVAAPGVHRTPDISKCTVLTCILACTGAGGYERICVILHGLGYFGE